LPSAIRIVKITTTTARVLIGVVASLLTLQWAVAAITPPPPPGPDGGDSYELYVADQINYDSNLYRLPPGYVPSTLDANASRSVVIDAATVGGAYQQTIGRQTIELNAHVDENRYFSHNYLDNTSLGGRAQLDWLATSALTGQLRADYSRGLAPFAETLYYGRDLISTADYFGLANYQLGPHWSVSGIVNESDFTHSAVAAQYGNFKARNAEGSVEYVAGVDESFNFSYSYLDGSYGQETLFNGVLTNRDYHESSERFEVKYPITEKTLIYGYGGYLERTFVEAAIGRYQGDIWRVSIDWRPTDKTDLVGSAWHELHSYSSNEADYFVSKGGSISPVWTASEKVTVSLVFSLEDEDYIAASSSILLTGPRSDKVTGQQINVLYTPRGNLFLNLFLRHEQRSSNLEEFTYKDELANASVTYKFF